MQPLDFRGCFSHTIVHEPSFLTGLNAFWKEASLDDLKLWARVHVVIGSTLELPHEFDETNFDFYGKTLSGQKEQRVRWKRGVSLVNGICGEDVGREYVKRHFPETSKQRMEQLVGNLIDAYRVSISNSTWLGDETKAKALEKLSKFVPKIGYTNHWRDYSALDVRENAGFAENMRAANLYETGYQLAKVGKSVDKDEWLMNPQTVNAYYEPSMNVIVFPAAILQPPFFNPDAEDAANYGGIGAVIGHEIGHGFDDQGAQYDGDGKLNDWWTEEDKANFKALTQKLIDQYNEFVPTQLAEKYSDDPSKAPHVNGALTIGENIGIASRELTMTEMREAAHIACIDETIDSLTKGYDTIVGERGVTLSGGQKQRAAIARTLTRKTPILVFDDSLSAVDAQTDVLIRTRLRERMKDSTVILISHRVTTLMEADQIMVMDKGHVTQLGTHEELMKQENGMYRRIYDLQMSLKEEEDA